MRRIKLVVAVLLAVLAASPRQSVAADKPDIVIIMVDDMGFSDVGCYGSEIDTPHLDRLAAGGLRFTQFYNTGRCCPTRAALLTGLYPHQAGMGHMTDDFGSPAYQGHLNDRCVTIAQALKPAGYFTAVSGKWHVGSPRAAFHGDYHRDDNLDDPDVARKLREDYAAMQAAMLSKAGQEAGSELGRFSPGSFELLFADLYEEQGGQTPQ